MSSRRKLKTKTLTTWDELREFFRDLLQKASIIISLSETISCHNSKPQGSVSEYANLVELLLGKIRNHLHRDTGLTSNDKAANIKLFQKLAVNSFVNGLHRDLSLLPATLTEAISLAIAEDQEMRQQTHIKTGSWDTKPSRENLQEARPSGKVVFSATSQDNFQPERDFNRWDHQQQNSRQDRTSFRRQDFRPQRDLTPRRDNTSQRDASPRQEVYRFKRPQFNRSPVRDNSNFNRRRDSTPQGSRYEICRYCKIAGHSIDKCRKRIVNNRNNPHQRSKHGAAVIGRPDVVARFRSTKSATKRAR